ncbi:uncharacterized protein RB166_021287 [Leptodactylus fuscus]
MDRQSAAAFDVTSLVLFLLQGGDLEENLEKPDNKQQRWTLSIKSLQVTLPSLSCWMSLRQDMMETSLKSLDQIHCHKEQPWRALMAAAVAVPSASRKDASSGALLDLTLRVQPPASSSSCIFLRSPPGALILGLGVMSSTSDIIPPLRRGVLRSRQGEEPSNTKSKRRREDRSLFTY